MPASLKNCSAAFFDLTAFCVAFSMVRTCSLIWISVIANRFDVQDSTEMVPVPNFGLQTYPFRSVFYKQKLKTFLNSLYDEEK